MLKPPQQAGFARGKAFKRTSQKVFDTGFFSRRQKSSSRFRDVILNKALRRAMAVKLRSVMSWFDEGVVTERGPSAARPVGSAPRLAKHSKKRAAKPKAQPPLIKEAINL